MLLKRTETKVRKLPLIICTAMTAALCFSCGDKEKGDGRNHMYDIPLCGNPQSLDPQFAADPSSNTVIKNLYSGLVSADENGNISCCNALSYNISPDGLTYSFTLRQDNFWSIDRNRNDIIEEDECFPVVADDYVFALQRLLDPKMQSPYALDFSCIKNGEQIISGQASPDTAGVSAPDDFTLVIELEHPSAEFMGMLASTAAFPCNREFFDSTKGKYGLDDQSVMSNGPFYMRQWFYDPYGVHNILYMRRNDKNVTETYAVMPSHLNFTIQKNEADIRQLFKDEEIECITTLSGSYRGSKYSVSSSRPITLGLIFNDEDRLFRSTDLRKALALATDRDSLEEVIGSDITVASGIIPPAVTLAGRSYRELVSDGQFARFDVTEAKECLDKAKKSLGVGSVDQVKILVNADTVDSGDLHKLSQSWQELLGVYIGIEDVTPEEFEKRISQGEYSLALYPLTGDINSGISVMEQFTKEQCLKKIPGTEGVMDKLMACGTVAEAVEAYTSAERDILSGYGFVPLFYKNAYLVAEKDNEDIFYDPFSGAVDYRIAQNYS